MKKETSEEARKEEGKTPYTGVQIFIILWSLVAFIWVERAHCTKSPFI